MRWNCGPMRSECGPLRSAYRSRLKQCDDSDCQYVARSRLGVRLDRARICWAMEGHARSAPPLRGSEARTGASMMAAATHIAAVSSATVVAAVMATTAIVMVPVMSVVMVA